MGHRGSSSASGSTNTSRARVRSSRGVTAGCVQPACGRRDCGRLSGRQATPLHGPIGARCPQRGGASALAGDLADAFARDGGEAARSAHGRHGRRQLVQVGAWRGIVGHGLSRKPVGPGRRWRKSSAPDCGRGAWANRLWSAERGARVALSSPVPAQRTARENRNTETHPRPRIVAVAAQGASLWLNPFVSAFFRRAPSCFAPRGRDGVVGGRRVSCADARAIAHASGRRRLARAGRRGDRSGAAPDGGAMARQVSRAAARDASAKRGRRSGARALSCPERSDRGAAGGRRRRAAGARLAWADDGQTGGQPRQRPAPGRATHRAAHGQERVDLAALGLHRRRRRGARPEQPLREVRVPRASMATSAVEFGGVLDQEEQTVILMTIDRVTAAGVVIRVALGLGLRKSELRALRWEEVDVLGAEPAITVRFGRGPTKSGKPRRIPIFGFALEALIAWRLRAGEAASGLLFPAGATGRASCRCASFARRSRRRTSRGACAGTTCGTRARRRFSWGGGAASGACRRCSACWVTRPRVRQSATCTRVTSWIFQAASAMRSRDGRETWQTDEFARPMGSREPPRERRR